MYLPVQLSLLLIPGAAIYFASLTLQGEQAIKRRVASTHILALQTTGRIFIVLGILGIVSVLLSPILLVILLPALSLMLTVWMLRRRAAQSRFLYASLLLAPKLKEPLPLLETIAEFSPWWTRRQLRKATAGMKQGDSAARAVRNASIPMTLATSLATLESSRMQLDGDIFLNQSENHTKCQQAYREFVQAWNYLFALAILSMIFCFSVESGFSSLRRELVANFIEGPNTPVSFLNEYTKDPSILIAVSLTIAGLILIGVLLTVIMNLDPLGLWPWNWPPSRWLHGARDRAITLHYIGTEISQGRLSSEVMDSMTREHPISRLQHQCKSIMERSQYTSLGFALAKDGWIESRQAEALSTDIHGETASGLMLQGIAQRQLNEISERWRLFTFWFRTCATIVIGLLVGWHALSVFAFLAQIIQGLSR